MYYHTSHLAPYGSCSSSGEFDLKGFGSTKYCYAGEIFSVLSPLGPSRSKPTMPTTSYKRPK